MLKPINSILFATTLADNCKPALDFAISMATRYHATLVFLHVIEKMPNYVESRLRGLLGEKTWKDISENYEKSAREIIGKESNQKLIWTALKTYCDDVGISGDACGYQSHEIVLCDGEIVHEIIEQSIKYECDLIIMGSRKGFIKDNTIGGHIKRVLRKSKIPVLIVPPIATETLT
ncbi:universal stress protein [Desulfobacterales bacterium HSG16]|nr:universal stress protein [Desulfobacterales bacterium HSG16]